MEAVGSALSQPASVERLALESTGVTRLLPRTFCSMHGTKRDPTRAVLPRAVIQRPVPPDAVLPESAAHCPVPTRAPVAKWSATWRQVWMAVMAHPGCAGWLDPTVPVSHRYAVFCPGGSETTNNAWRDGRMGAVWTTPRLQSPHRVLSGCPKRKHPASGRQDPPYGDFQLRAAASTAPSRTSCTAMATSPSSARSRARKGMPSRIAAWARATA